MTIISLKSGKPAACPPDSNATAHSNGAAQAQSLQAQAAVPVSAALPVVNTTILMQRKTMLDAGLASGCTFPNN